jgi:hypothetical protein
MWVKADFLNTFLKRLSHRDYKRPSSWGLSTVPTISLFDADDFLKRFDDRALCCLLLFPKSDQTMLRILKKNWNLFSAATGNNVHIITLLDSKSPTSADGLRFPPQYEISVGAFCNELEIRPDSLPALFLINATDDRGPPYWPLDKDNKTGSAVLEQLVSDLCEATFNLLNDLEPNLWRNTAAKMFFNIRSNQEIVQFVKTNVNLKTLTRLLIHAVQGHLAGL